jgi:hypothetical protein
MDEITAQHIARAIYGITPEYGLQTVYMYQDEAGAIYEIEVRHNYVMVTVTQDGVRTVVLNHTFN